MERHARNDIDVYTQPRVQITMRQAMQARLHWCSILLQARVTQTGLGILTLFIGALVYITDRPAESVMLINNYTPDLSMYNKIPAVFGIIGNNLPGFIHTFSFSMITAGAFGKNKTDYRAICLFWFTINTLCELGQRFSQIAIKLSPIESMHRFFLNGTFDIFDIAAFALGGIAAYLLLTTIGKKELTV